MADNEEDKHIDLWRVRKLVEHLEQAKGNGTSMVSLIIPAGDQISRYSKMLAEEYGTASNIKSRVNRLSVLAAITSTQQKLKLYTRVPPNGLVVYSGTVIGDEGKEKKVSMTIEPIRPIKQSLYLCDNKFHTEPLRELLEDDKKFGFIIMDGNGCLYGTVCGSTRTVLHSFSVDLPKKHGRGGQSAVRFSRLREEKRHHYVRKVCEVAVQQFIDNEKPNVQGLILAGSADFKSVLAGSDMFDPRLKKIVLKMVDVSYGGEDGFNQAIDLAQECLANVKLLEEKKLIAGYFEEISRDTGQFCFGVSDTMHALDLGSVDDLILWENLAHVRYVFRDNENPDVPIVRIMTPDDIKNKNDNNLFLSDTGKKLDVLDEQLLSEWIVQNYKNFGCRLHFITDRSQEGHQFVKGFGGIGGVLRWKVDMAAIIDAEMDDYDDLEDFM
ncbi:eukaryotic peptide chain release factor subunit 1 [Carpediemonas membranifera]|uniref:Eukaryotic peptide chain release factor subunit 1 n=1 Tax=Carpediemonas membranifera TaxID=201153 RepID=A0A8J6B0N3_9EUKA|nr:Peptide chain release factor eRF1/aRF1 [Carpediemonas membranifera]KAG9394752.1 eukaryotic peptide chain release factor subunit 1 [Carpediemonas membranifera]|eukprot:KAG9391744.1 Peptide chain release factor eRF1/aRF1 [Carpediemonas membranifera]